MTIYIDSDFVCNAEYAPGLVAVDTDFFDGKCAEYIKGYRFIPEGKSWTDPNGVVFAGTAVFPWKDWRELDAAQREYERQQISAYEQALSEIEKALGV